MLSHPSQSKRHHHFVTWVLPLLLLTGFLLELGSFLQRDTIELPFALVVELEGFLLDRGRDDTGFLLGQQRTDCVHNGEYPKQRRSSE